MPEAIVSIRELGSTNAYAEKLRGSRGSVPKTKYLD
jgi:hypothetical protein